MIIQKTTYVSVTPISRRTKEPLKQSEPIDYGTLDYYVWVVIIILKVVLFNKTFAVALIKHHPAHPSPSGYHPVNKQSVFLYISQYSDD